MLAQGPVSAGDVGRRRRGS